jgi:hypothetical protein
MAVRIEHQAEPIPGYRLLERIGGGGFGEVWKCEAPGGLQKAIKFVFGDLNRDGDTGHRAEQELKALSRVKSVRHPYILSLERYDILDGQLLIVMELADRNLWDRFKECRAQGLPGIPRDELLNYVEETAEALDLMNREYQLQHLDIKPQNLFLVHSHVKVADFGLVKDLEGMQASVTGGVTPVYAAPETFDGWVSRFCDQYSLAIVYQELLTGQRPFSGTSVRQLILQHLQASPNVSPLPPPDQPVVTRALAKNPDDRFPTCGDFVRRLRAASRPGPAAPNGAPAADAGLPHPRDSGDTGRGGEEVVQTVDLRVRAPGPAPAEPPGPPPTRPALSANGTAAAAPAEVRGEGALFPALVLGVGQLGLTVLQQLRERLAARFGSPEALPHLRTLLLDTDPDVTRSATRGPGGAALPADDVVLAPLNRASHYLKAEPGKPPPVDWISPRILHRIPRSRVTTGVRALGRVALFDNYRAVARRLRAALDAARAPDALEQAARQTGLGVRTNRPRVYLVTGVAGGTGGGMFLDLAYAARALLRQAGYDAPDVTGLLLVPPVDQSRTGALTVGNAYAALTELAYYGAPGTAFAARYHDGEGAVLDPDPPFGCCVVLPLPEEGDEAAARAVAETAGLFLERDLCSPLGRAADLARAGRPAPPREARGLSYRTFGLCRLSWPRRALVRAAARQLGRRLVQRWMSKDTKPVREAVQTWAREQWALHELGADSFIERLREEADRLAGRTTDAAFRPVLAPLADKMAAAAAAAAAPPKRGAPPAPEFGPEEVADALWQFEGLVGKPEEEFTSNQLGELGRAVRQAADRLIGQWGQKLAELPVQLIEEPAYRLAGAEEAIRHLVVAIEQILQHHEPLTRDLAAKAAGAHARLAALAAGPRPGVRKGTAAEVAELLQGYPKWRYQGLVMSEVFRAFVSLRGHLSDELREVNFCRVRLTELLRLVEAAEPPPEAAPPAMAGRRLLPPGCKEFDDAVEWLLAGVSAEGLLELDHRAEAVIKAQFQALVHVCLNDTGLIKNVQAALLETAEAFAAELMPETDAAEVFFEHHPDPAAAEAAVAALLREAEPALGRGREDAAEVCLVAAPPGPAGDRFRDLVRRACPAAEFADAADADDIVVYRERPSLPLGGLEQLGPAAREAYRQMTASENFTPHARADVDFKSAAG